MAESIRTHVYISHGTLASFKYKFNFRPADGRLLLSQLWNILSYKDSKDE